MPRIVRDTPKACASAREARECIREPQPALPRLGVEVVVVASGWVKHFPPHLRHLSSDNPPRLPAATQPLHGHRTGKTRADVRAGGDSRDGTGLTRGGGVCEGMCHGCSCSCSCAAGVCDVVACGVWSAYSLCGVHVRIPCAVCGVRIPCAVCGVRIPCAVCMCVTVPE